MEFLGGSLVENDGVIGFVLDYSRSSVINARLVISRAHRGGERNRALSKIRLTLAL